MSTVFIPAFDAIIGPIVEPHGLSFLTMKSYKGMLNLSPKILKIDALTASVAYL